VASDKTISHSHTPHVAKRCEFSEHCHPSRSRHHHPALNIVIVERSRHHHPALNIVILQRSRHHHPTRSIVILERSRHHHPALNIVILTLSAAKGEGSAFALAVACPFVCHPAGICFCPCLSRISNQLNPSLHNQKPAREALPLCRRPHLLVLRFATEAKMNLSTPKLTQPNETKQDKPGVPVTPNPIK
jgi:hypothetical protein